MKSKSAGRGRDAGSDREGEDDCAPFQLWWVQSVTCSFLWFTLILLTNQCHSVNHSQRLKYWALNGCLPSEFVHKIVKWQDPRFRSLCYIFWQVCFMNTPPNCTHKKAHVSVQMWCKNKCTISSVTRRERQRDREGEKPQWCTPKTADRSFANSCYCQQLRCSFSLHRNPRSILHKLFHNFLYSYYTTAYPVLVKVNQLITKSEWFWKEKSTIILPLPLHAQSEHIWTWSLPYLPPTGKLFTSFSRFLKSHHINKPLSGSMFL